MGWFRLNALAVGSLTTTILLGALTLYLLALRKKGPATWWLTGYLGSLFLLLLAYTVRYCVFAPAALVTGQVSNLIVFGVASLIQFAYWFGGNPYRRESYVVLVLTLGASITVWGMLFLPGRYPAVYDFHAEYFTYEFGASVSILTLAEYLWALVVFVRRAAAPGPHKPGGPPAVLRRLRHPRGAAAISHRSFALLTAATLPIALQYLLFQTGIIPRATYALVFNTGSLLICLLIFIVYINNAPHPTSFLTKLVGIPLAVLMVAFGIASNALMPAVEQTIMERYRVDTELAGVALEAQQLGRLPHDVAYLLPTSAELDTLRYGSPRPFRPTEMLLRAVPGGMKVQTGRPAVQFHYNVLMDTSTFYLSLPLFFHGERFSVGFSYGDYRLQVHEFASKLAIVALFACLVVILGFPLFFRRGLLSPLRALLGAVDRVSRGNFREEVCILSEDEIGRLSLGYNRMITALSNMEGNFKALAENAYDAIIILSTTGEVLYANERVAQLTGRSTGRLLGTAVSRILASNAPVPTELSARQSGAQGSESFETTALRDDGSVVPIEVTVAATTWQTTPALVVIARDVSERKRTEEILRTQHAKLMRMDKMTSLGELVAAVAHEINNPNHVVTMGARFLEEGIPSLFAIAETSTELDEGVRLAGKAYPAFKEAYREAVEDIKRSAHRIDHIVAELKRYVRGASPQRKRVDLNEVVTSVVDLARYMIGQAGARLAVKLAESPVNVVGDFVELEQVVLNLLENACQSLSEKGGEVSIVVRHTNTDGEACIGVEDTGRGMSAAELAHVTEPFYTSRAADGGTGLGLSVVNRIVRTHGGRLSFVSTPGRGTHVTVHLPTPVEDMQSRTL